MTIQLNVGSESVSLVGNSVTYDASRVADELEGRGVTDIDGLSTATAVATSSDAVLAKINGTWSLLDLDALSSIVDDDSGATVANTASTTTLLASSPISMPVPRAGDVFKFTSSGSWLNVSGGPLTDTITAQWNGNDLWTPAAFTIANGGISTYLIEAIIRCPTAGASGQTVITETKFTVNTVGAQTIDTTNSKFVVFQRTSQNTSAATNITLTAAHSTNGAFSTFGYGSALRRFRRNF